MANIIKTILPDLIGSTQTIFVLRRYITENIVIVQEIIHSMRKKKGKRGQMLIKVNIEKAYDCLSWEFVHETLHGVGLPSDLIHLIMDYISLATIQILWIGECIDCFSPLRGLRQGDPISPYIFVISRINKAVQSKHWKPIRLSQRGIPITHLLFF